MILFGLAHQRGLVIMGVVLAFAAGVWLASSQRKEKCGVSGNYDVFLSFRGADTRTGFVDFLYNALVAEGVRVVRDKEDLPRGEETHGELIRAVKSSKISIPIISKDYVGSGSSLRELAEMKKYREVCGQLIFPIFYDVSLDEIQELKGHVGEAFHLLKSTVDDAKAISQWEEALRSVTKIKGWESHKIADRVLSNSHDTRSLIDSLEGVLISTVVDKVLSELRTISVNSARQGNIANWLIRAGHHLVRQRSIGAESQYQVFLSFHDEDTRTSFIDFLYVSLVNAGVRVFSIDDPSLIGKDFAEEVYGAINNCKIFIPVISQHYASSVWCLSELAQMMDRKERSGQKVMPIFYKVKPSQLQNVPNEFKEAWISDHANGFDGSIVDKWEQALRDIGFSKGLESEETAEGHEGKLVQLVVTDILSELNKTRYNSENQGTWRALNKWPIVGFAMILIFIICR